MKLRIHKDSIRFRFTRQEVETLSGGQPLEERVAVGPSPQQALVYRVVPEIDVSGRSGIRAGFESNTLTVTAPKQIFQAWHDGEQLAIEEEQIWTTGKVRILLEKDMQRLNPKEGEEAPGIYPNPLFGKVRCDHP